jgi:hypothetical protein
MRYTYIALCIILFFIYLRASTRCVYIDGDYGSVCHVSR